METRSLYPLEPSGGVVGCRLPPASQTSARAERLFDREVERAAQRAGGEEAVEKRRSAHSERRRGERRAGFEAAPEPARQRPSGREAKTEQRPATARRDPGEAEIPAPAAHPAPPRPAPEDPRAASTGNAAPAPAPEAAGTAAAPLAPPDARTAAAAGPAAHAPAARPAPAAGADALPPSGPSGKAAGGAARPDGATRAAPHEPAAEEAREVLRQIRLHFAQGVREATLTLVPEHLGRLQVKLALARGKVAALVRAESPRTLELLERHLPELKAALAEQGLAVESFELELGLSGNGRPDRGGTGSEGRARSPLAGAPAAHDARLAHLLQRLSPGAGGVDTYA